MVHTAVHSDFVGDLLPMTCDVVRALASAWKYLSIAHYYSSSRIQRSTELCFGLSRELAVPPSKLVLLFNAAFCRRDKSLSHSRKKGWMVGAVGDRTARGVELPQVIDSAKRQKGEKPQEHSIEVRAGTQNSSREFTAIRSGVLPISPSIPCCWIHASFSSPYTMV